jgi:amino acid adenylation domain-containing protein
MSHSSSKISRSPVERVIAAASKFPEHTALELDDARYSYRELTEAAASIAASISELDDPSPFVAVMGDKSFSCFAGILGIMMAGKAYLPLNPRFPAVRSAFMLEKSRIRTLVAGDNSDDELDSILDNYSSGMYVIFAEESSAEVKCEFSGPASPAYLLFTSGTTGQPKGVPVSNRNLESYLAFMMKTFDFRPEDRFTQNFDLTFDLSVHDMFLAWSTGACLCVPKDNSSFAMAGFIREKQPTVWFSVPSVVNLLDRMRLLKPGTFPSVRLSFFCGEALHSKTAEAWKTAASQSQIINLYGPTEATIAVAHYTLPKDSAKWKSELGIISIGKVFEGNSVKILEDDTNPGFGELCLSGSQVVTGYFENEPADKEAFFREPVEAQLWYRTGDLVRIDEDGDLFYTGRKDSEVKVSGYRVNLKEIENVLSTYEAVGQAVVIYDQASGGQGMIRAFVVADNPAALAEKDLDEYCRQRLPWYMVPGKFIFVDEIPLNINGKADLAALRMKYGNS